MAKSAPSPKNTRTMNQYTQQYNALQASSKFDEAAADLTAFLDLSSYTNVSSTDPSSVVALSPLDDVNTSFSNAFSFASAPPIDAVAPLRPVDDALLDSPLGLELSPAGSCFTASSISGSPYDLDMTLDFAGTSSPLFSTFSGSPAFAPELAFPATSSTGFATPNTITTAELPSLFAALPLATPALQDIKPLIEPSTLLSRNASAESLPFAATPTTEQEETEAQKRKSIAEIKREAAQLVEEKQFTQDKHKGFRNTKKAPVEYDAPTLPKNYLTESATSKKRAGSSKVAASVNKRARTSASPALPPTAATPIAAEDLDEEQLTAIELKRRQNTLAARRSRARKAETFRQLQEEIDRLKQQNEALMAENQRLKEKAGE
ncbi:hypothetical protein JCM1840_002405 [Sporobolomyces johnsonii]